MTALFKPEKKHYVHFYSVNMYKHEQFAKKAIFVEKTIFLFYIDIFLNITYNSRYITKIIILLKGVIMYKTKKLSFIAIVLMTIFSFSGFLKLFNENITNLSSVTLLIGIVVYFITREPEEKDAMSLKSIPGLFKDWKVILLVLSPIAADIVCYVLAKLFVPEFLVHLAERTDFLSFDKMLIMVAELIIAALGEEIAWRGFFLNQLSKKINFVPCLLITSCLFAICHLSAGSVVVIVYDLTFIIINAVLYGLVYKRTNNIIVSTISHFLSNLFSVLIILLPFIR